MKMAFALKSAAVAAITAFVLATPAGADSYRTITDRNEFLSIVGNRSLAIPVWGVDLTVTPDGRIRGEGAGEKVSGAWRWSNGYFCRDLKWGDRDLGANCQQVAVRAGKVRFTSDRGAGRSASFRLR